jgi:hypothetical protein
MMGALSLLLFPLGSFGRPAAGNTWSGTWDTNFGVMTLTQSGASITGTYTYDSGKITGHVSGNVATGTWSEAPSYAGPSDAGPFKWTLSSAGKSWSGQWTYAGGASGGTWSGSCTGGTCLKNGDAPEDEAKTTRYRISVTAVNRIHSRISGSGIVTKIERGRSRSWRATGTLRHLDEYFTSAQDERLTLRIAAGTLTYGDSSDPYIRANLTFVVAASNHKDCPVGARGLATVTGEIYGSQGERIGPAEVRLRVCQSEHDHRYVNTKTYPVKVSINEIKAG